MKNQTRMIKMSPKQHFKILYFIDYINDFLDDEDKKETLRLINKNIKLEE
jgi:hypothetical protein